MATLEEQIKAKQEEIKNNTDKRSERRLKRELEELQAQLKEKTSETTVEEKTPPVEQITSPQKKVEEKVEKQEKSEVPMKIDAYLSNGRRILLTQNKDGIIFIPPFTRFVLDKLPSAYHDLFIEYGFTFNEIGGKVYVVNSADLRVSLPIDKFFT